MTAAVQHTLTQLLYPQPKSELCSASVKPPPTSNSKKASIFRTTASVLWHLDVESGPQKVCFFKGTVREPIPATI